MAATTVANIDAGGDFPPGGGVNGVECLGSSFNWAGDDHGEESAEGQRHAYKLNMLHSR